MTDQVKPRPRTLRGTTYKMETPVGTAFITINTDESGNPFEIFINIGKAGNDVLALAEAIGRSLSLHFRTAADSRERALEIIEQFEGIGGSRSIGFGPNRVRSLPDAVAKVLREHLGLATNGNGVSIAGSQAKTVAVTESHSTDKSGDLCPECGQAALIHEEGCQKCKNCGYSKC